MAEAGVALPQILFDWDEASATQAVYMYAQIARNFGGHAGAFFDADSATPGRMFIRQGGFLRSALEEFDAGFFGIPPREAAAHRPLPPLVRVAILFTMRQ